MSHYLDELAFEMERHMVNAEDIDTSQDLPEEIREYIRLLEDMNAGGDPFSSEYIKYYGGPTGVAKHPEYGWALLGCGQGPFILWSEKELPEEKNPEPPIVDGTKPLW